ncbi:MAG: hypothetical protein P4L79_14035 [Legionella sp.]|uniref:hypothetical protein n=1 Tax=Legionella sp. TaxID=459 RepID=UPI002841F696|nr:hypothetical protein [Legionella sp.]
MNAPNSSPLSLIRSGSPVPTLIIDIIPDIMPIIAHSPQQRPENSQEVLGLLFSEDNINARFEERCSSLQYFNNKAFGKPSAEELVNDQIDNPLFPEFKRLGLADLPNVRAEGGRSDFRFAVINQNDKVYILFSKWSGKLIKGDGMSHSQLACGKEESSTCIAAGEIEFVDVGGKWHINRLSNETGHFQCPVETLIAPLILLIEQDVFPFASQFTLALEYGNDSQEIEINFADLRKSYDTEILAKESNNTTENSQIFVQLEQPIIQEKEIGELSLLTTNSFFAANSQRLSAKIDPQQDEEHQEDAGSTFIPRPRY